ncbi:class I SAM-dependent methyltransferase [Paraferrimonas haliotis]|uniref:class I SAM-dependent methyltransferase n=1 Tax=Paraferrimonas haliotis TaxID=2013866 RepID=UPI0015CE536C|nr:class I SAM-dependent methyltransferase [Paraferrimonas haliotis]
MTAHWNNYWAQGNTSSFADEVDNEFQEQVDRIWLEAVAELSPQHQLLDIATGNGTIPLQLMKHTSKLPSTIVGCDLAKIDGQFAQQQAAQIAPEIRLIFDSEVNCETLPYEDQRFQLVCSQFGVEYSQLALSLKQIHRVLSANGTAQFICHHQDSFILKQNRHTLALLESQAFAELFQRGHQLNQAYGDISSRVKLRRALSSDDVKSANQNISALCDRLIEDHQDELSSTGALEQIQDVFSRYIQEPLSSRASRLNDVEQVYKLHTERLKDLRSAALSATQMANLEDLATQIGFITTSSEPIYCGQRLLGWHVKLSK